MEAGLAEKSSTSEVTLRERCTSAQPQTTASSNFEHLDGAYKKAAEKYPLFTFSHSLNAALMKCNSSDHPLSINLRGQVQQTSIANRGKHILCLVDDGFVVVLRTLNLEKICEIFAPVSISN